MPTPLDLSVHGNLWQTVRENAELYDFGGSDLDVLTDPLNRFDAGWLGGVLRGMDLDLLYRFETPGEPPRDERDVLFILRLARCMQKDYIDSEEADFAKDQLGRADVSFEAVDLSSLKKDDQNCSICFEPFRSNESPEDPCRVSCKAGHIFGINCIRN